jgi:hypothetical protein
MAEDNPFATAAVTEAARAVASNPELQRAAISAAVTHAPAAASFAANEISARAPAAANFASKKAAEATGGAGWWLLFTGIDVLMALAMLINGILMEASIFSGGALVKFGDLGFITNIFLGVYMVVFSILAGLSSFVWFTCLGKFIGFFYFMWGRGAAYMVIGSISLNAPWTAFTAGDSTGIVTPPIVIFSGLLQFVVALVLIVMGVLYVILGFIPQVRRLYRPVCAISGPNNVASTDEYWFGKEKYAQKYGGGRASGTNTTGDGGGYAPPEAGRFN